MSLGGLVKHTLGILRPTEILVSGKHTTGNEVALTFDDGPHPVNTPRILEIMANSGTTATFFLQGNLAERYPLIVRAIHQGGHQVANHGYEHLSAKQHPAPMVAANAARCQAILEDQLGCSLPRDFRPPYGDIRISSYLALRRLGFRMVFWSCDSMDSFVSSADQVLEKVRGSRLPAGSIVLFHDDASHTVAALPAIIADCGDNSRTLVRIRDFRPQPG